MASASSIIEIRRACAASIIESRRACAANITQNHGGQALVTTTSQPKAGKKKKKNPTETPAHPTTPITAKPRPYKPPPFQSESDPIRPDDFFFFSLFSVWHATLRLVLCRVPALCAARAGLDAAPAEHLLAHAAKHGAPHEGRDPRRVRPVPHLPPQLLLRGGR
jgi:hypothetical protein